MLFLFHIHPLHKLTKTGTNLLLVFAFCLLKKKARVFGIRSNNSSEDQNCKKKPNQ